jgi:hypothetical protein
MRTATQIKAELNSLTSLYSLMNNPKVTAALSIVRAENAERVAALKVELGLAQKPRPLRWPDNTPSAVLELCRDYWRGTTEYHFFRIHEWNEVAVWTSYPAGGYSTAGGWNPTPPAYEMISRSERESCNIIGGRPKSLKSFRCERNSGKRVTSAMRLAELEKLKTL